ncbi:MAG: Asp-tRNA(Asn)/Glu-tRNA(Gln) amidotransferase subunit GatC [Ignavibacteriae bacterium]|nr:Asp-tRNA(Asn)/Glu-tRNA(Gln) amidotransferase subunit GatC [Ignavibacteriota bacterium]MCB9214804.1 Asp-tRNA(Asn)/Glu-tRNA(Gln) amidotransferase subunit GatC [Ignavibacteria bacterium]
MHTNITQEEVRRVAALAKLRFSDEEIESFTEQFDRIVAYVEKLNEVDCTGVEPMARVGGEITPPREDTPGELLEPAEALKNAPKKMEGFFSVPKVIE